MLVLLNCQEQTTKYNSSSIEKTRSAKEEGPTVPLSIVLVTYSLYTSTKAYTLLFVDDWGLAKSFEWSMMPFFSINSCLLLLLNWQDKYHSIERTTTKDLPTVPLSKLLLPSFYKPQRRH